MKIKLWQKIIFGIASIGALSSSLGLGLYLYSKSDVAKGEKHLSAEPLGMDLKDLKNIKKYNISFRDPLDNNVTIGNYEMNFKQNGANFTLKEGKVNNQLATKWIEDYYRKNRQSPVMYVYSGTGVKFTNFYTEVVLPEDFILFINWLANNIPWTPDISSLSSFSLKKGLKKSSNGTLTLGSFEAASGEKKLIKFFPDSFFKNNNISNYISKMNKIPLTKDELMKLINYINIENKKNNQQKIYPYSVEKLDKDKYDLFISNGGFDVIKGLNKMFSYRSNVSDIDISIDEHGKIVTTNRSSFKVPSSIDVSKLATLRAFASADKWKGIGLNFLKYVTAHEYGHMQTLSMSSDAVNNPVALGPSSNVGPNAGSPNGQTNIDILNMYLKARIPFINAVRVSPVLYLNPETKKYGYRTYKEALNHAKKNNLHVPLEDDFMNVAFEVIRDPKKSNIEKDLINIDKIFAGNNNPTRKDNMLSDNSKNKSPEWLNSRNKIIREIKNGIISGKKRFLFLMNDVKNFEAFADFLNVPSAAIAFINSNDNYVPTTSPTFVTDGFWVNPKTIPWGKVQDNETKNWIEDYAFKVKTKNGNHAWFTDDKKTISLSRFPNISYDDLEINSYESGKTWYVNPISAIVNGGDRNNLLTYIKSFIAWFENNIAYGGYFQQSGIDYLYEGKFNPEELEGFFESVYISGRPKPKAIKEAFSVLNDENQNKRFKSSAIGSNPELVDVLDIKKFSNLYLPSVYESIISVVNGKRVINFKSYAKYTFEEYKFEYLENARQSINNINKLNLVAFFEDEKSRKPFLLKDQHGDNIVSELNSADRDLKKWFDEMKNLYGEEVWVVSRKYKIVELIKNEPLKAIKLMKKIIFNKTISNANPLIQFNKDYKMMELEKNPIEINLDNVKFKTFSIEDFMELIFLDINNSQAKSAENSASGSKYIGLKNFSKYVESDSKLSKTQKDKLNTLIYQKLLNGYQDLKLTIPNIKKMVDLYKVMDINDKSPKQMENIFGKKLLENLLTKIVVDVNGKSSTKRLDWDKLPIFIFNQLNVINKSFLSNDKNVEVKTLAAMQFICNGLILNIKDPKKIKSSFDFPQFFTHYFERKNLKTWIDNPWSGYQSTLKGIFSNYNNLWSEVITRDLVQVTYTPNYDQNDKLSKFRYGNDYTDLTEGNTGILLYIDSKKSLNKDSQLYKLIHDSKINKDFIKVIDNLKAVLKKDEFKNKTKKSLVEKIIDSTIFNNSYKNLKQTFNKIISNDGYHYDRWARATLKDKKSIKGKVTSFVMYDDKSDPIVDTNIRITRPVIKDDGKIVFEKLSGQDQNRVNAFWWWLLGSYGVGNRTITGLWRLLERDAISMWGYIPTTLANKIKYIEAKNGNTIKYIPVKTEGTNNLFYLKKQGDKSTKRFLSDDGFSSWTIDLITMGNWQDSKLKEGQWTLKFVDKNKAEVKDPSNRTKNALTLGDKSKPGWLRKITENNKHASYAPVQLTTNNKGETILIIKPSFNI